MKNPFLNLILAWAILLTGPLPGASAATIIISGPRISAVAAACSTVAQSNTTAGSGSHSLGVSSSAIYMATKFTASSSFTLCAFAAQLQKTGSPTQTITPEIWSHNGGTDLPNALIQASATTVSASTFPANGSPAYVTFSGFSTAITSGTTYWLVLHITTGAADSLNCSQWMRNSTLDGTGSINVAQATSGGSWASLSTTRRLMFQIFQ